MTTEAVHGLDCPRCGGMVPIPEGQVIVKCPYCEQRSVVAAASPPPPSLPAPTAPPASAVPPAPVAPSAPASAHTPGAPDVPAPGGTTPAPAGGTTAPVGAPLAPIGGTPASAGDFPAAFSLPTSFSLPSQPAADVAPAAIAPAVESGSLGVRRYQAPLNITRDEAVQALNGFLSGKVQVARDAARGAQLQEAFLVHLPFWAVWGRGVAYAFGQVKVGSGDNERWEPREKKAARELTWNSPACEVGEFGVRGISLEGCPLEPFNPAALHRTGMVFEPVGAETGALEAARKDFEATIRGAVEMGRTAQLFTRLVRTRLGVLYYPLWVLRYLYRGRAFQVVVDGVKGEVLYGKAPGSVIYRAAVLVAGMALGAVAAIDIPALIMSASSSSDDNPFIFALIVFVVGLVIMYGSYRVFRYGEHYEYHRYQSGRSGKLPFNIGQVTQGNVRLDEVDVGKIIRTLEKFQ